MTRGLSIRSGKLLGICFALWVTPAHAQTAGAVEVSGFVAPRCWVATTPLWHSFAGLFAPRARAICNYSAPLLRSNMRALNADGSLAAFSPPTLGTMPAPAQLSGRTALEIVVSPQI